MKILEYPEVTSANNMQASDVILTDGTNGTKKALFSTFATWLLTKFNTLSLAGTAQTVKAAIDGLVTSITNLRNEINTVSSTTVNISFGAVSATFTARKVGKIVKINTISLGVNTGTPFSNVTANDLEIGTMPSGWRPHDNVTSTGLARTTGSWAAATYYPATITISSAGAITVQGNLENIKTCRYLSNGCISYIANS